MSSTEKQARPTVAEILYGEKVGLLYPLTTTRRKGVKGRRRRKPNAHRRERYLNRYRAEHAAPALHVRHRREPLRAASEALVDAALMQRAYVVHGEKIRGHVDEAFARILGMTDIALRGRMTKEFPDEPIEASETRDALEGRYMRLVLDRAEQEALQLLNNIDQIGSTNSSEHDRTVKKVQTIISPENVLIYQIAELPEPLHGVIGETEVVTSSQNADDVIEQIAAFLETQFAPLYELTTPSLCLAVPTGFNLHDVRHIRQVAKQTDESLQRTNPPADLETRVVACIAAWSHDLGNIFSRGLHPKISAELFDQLFGQALEKMAPQEAVRRRVRQRIRRAIKLHDDPPMEHMIKHIEATAAIQSTHAKEVIKTAFNEERTAQLEHILAALEAGAPPKKRPGKAIWTLGSETPQEPITTAFYTQRAHAEWTAFITALNSAHNATTDRLVQTRQGQDIDPVYDQAYWTRLIDALMTEQTFRAMRHYLGAESLALVAADKNDISPDRANVRTRFTAERDPHAIVNSVAQSEAPQYLYTDAETPNDPKEIELPILFSPTQPEPHNEALLATQRRKHAEGFFRIYVPEEWHARLKVDHVPYFNTWVAENYSLYAERFKMLCKSLFALNPTCQMVTFNLEDRLSSGLGGRSFRLEVRRHLIAQDIADIQSFFALPTAPSLIRDERDASPNSITPQEAFFEGQDAQQAAENAAHTGIYEIDLQPYFAKTSNSFDKHIPTSLGQWLITHRGVIERLIQFYIINHRVAQVRFMAQDPPIRETIYFKHDYQSQLDLTAQIRYFFMRLERRYGYQGEPSQGAPTIPAATYGSAQSPKSSNILRKAGSPERAGSSLPPHQNRV